MDELRRIAEQIGGIDDPAALLAGLFRHAPVAFVIYRASGQCALVNDAFRGLFGGALPDGYNIFDGKSPSERTFSEHIRRAAAGETVRVPAYWYKPSVLPQRERQMAIEVTLFPLLDRASAITHVALCFKDVTAEQLLRRDEEEIAATLRSVGDAVIATDIAGRVVRMSSSAEQLTGWPLADARGEPLDRVFRIVHEETRLPVESPVTHVLREGTVVGLANHTVLIARDGTERAIADSGAPIRVDGGRVQGVVLVFRDVTAEHAAEHEQKLQQEALARSEAMLRLALQASRSFAWTLDFTTRESSFIGEPNALASVAPGLLIEDRVALVHADDRERVRAELAAAFQGLAPPQYTYRRFDSATRGYRWLEARSVFLRDADGNVVGASGLSMDITEHKHAEEALGASERRFRKLIERSADLVTLHSADGTILYASPSVERLLGYRVDEHEGHHPFEFLHPDTHAAAADEIARAVQQPGVAQVTRRRVRHKNGSWRWMEGSVVNLLDDADVRALVSNQHDVTDQVRADELRERSVELELQNRHAQEASRLKSEFLANMSHELRTPLNAIIGFTELLHDGQVEPSSPDHQEFLGAVLGSARHLLQLINDVLDLAKIEAGKLVFFAQPVNLTGLIGETCGILRTIAAAKHIQVEIDADSSVAQVTLDPSRFKQVLYNYLSNALKFTPEGGRVVVRTRPEGAEAFRLEVEDTGIGIAPIDLGRLFINFQQIEDAATKRHAGTGLGLALTRRLIETQGGQVGVRSTLGKGSVFHAILPRYATSQAAHPPPRELRQEGASSILVVEDDPTDQAFLVETLFSAGYAVEAVATGAEALARCQERTFDAITLDLLLPDMSGFDVLTGIAASGRHAKVPIVIVSAVTDSGALTRFSAHGILYKPVNPQELWAALARAGVPPRPRE